MFKLLGRSRLPTRTAGFACFMDTFTQYFVRMLLDAGSDWCPFRQPLYALNFRAVLVCL
jgi:hypothetical protein